jgi:hypothetical protein
MLPARAPAQRAAKLLGGDDVRDYRPRSRNRGDRRVECNESLADLLADPKPDPLQTVATSGLDAESVPARKTNNIK